MGRPRVDAETALAPLRHHVVAIEHDEGESEAAVHLVAPLQDDGGRRGNDDAADFLADQELANDQARLDCLAQADVVRDEQVHARQQQRLPQRLELIGFDLDARAVGRLEQLRIRGGNGIPAKGVEVGREGPRVVESALGNARPRVALSRMRVYFRFPEDLEGDALRVVFEAGEANERQITAVAWLDILDQVLARANGDDVAGLRRDVGKHAEGDSAAL